tara:strand:- start:4511 stop:5179 length:669 start_codon:yes stop_codon:yes gene_type:complete
MNKNIKILIFITVFIFISTYSPTPKNKKRSLIFPIKIILIENTNIIDQKKLIDELDYLRGQSLFFVDKSWISNTMNKFDFISTIQVKKIYPDKFKVIIKEKKPIAIFVDGKQKKYISNKGKFINFIYNHEFTSLPHVFGKVSNFIDLYHSLENLNFPIEEIKDFYFFNIGRWDIVLKNEKIIKLPIKNYSKILSEFILLNKKNTFDEYQIIDYRIEDQLILN